MAKILPFCGYTYNLSKVSPDSVLAPPYDVVTEAEKKAYIEKHPYNILSLEMPDLGEGEGHGGHNNVGSILESWIREGIVSKDPTPCVYPYETVYEVNGRQFTRTGLVCLVGIEPWETGVILPHEKTFKKVTDERLRLLKTARAQFSQIFLLSKGEKTLTQVSKDEKRDFIYEAKDKDGNIHRLFRLSDEDAIEELKKALSSKCLYIADGHHRYTTALAFKEMCDREGVFKGVNPPPHHYVMAYLVDSTDPGLLSLPTHRIVKSGGDEITRIVEVLSPYLQKVAEFDAGTEIKKVQHALEKLGRSTGFALCTGADNRCVVFSLTEMGKGALLNQGIAEGLLDLDVIPVDELAIRKLFNKGASELKEEGRLRYEAFFDRLDSIGKDEILFYLRPTPINAMMGVAEAGLTMPHKATYFYPKILTGTVIRLL